MKVRTLSTSVPLAATFLLVSLIFGSIQAGAGDSWTQGGDCWRPGTPNICRVGWLGANSNFQIQWFNMMPGDEVTLLNNAIAAMNSWNNAPGPQHQGFNPNTGATLVYLWTDPNLPYGSATAANFDRSGNIIPFERGTGAVWWTDIRTSPLNRSNPNDMRIWLHELGHALMLGHHSRENRGVMWPWSNQFLYDAPTDFDLGPLPPCTGIGHEYMGVRCIYNYGH